MIGRVMLLALAAGPAWAELAFSVVADGGETPIAAQVQLAPAAVGDALDTLFRVRNIGKSNAPVTAITIGGMGFSLANVPELPASLAPSAYLDFVVHFQPLVAATYSAVLKSDGITVFVLGTGVPVVSVYVEENGSRRPLDTAGLDFGTVERGTRASRRLILANETSQQLAVTPAIIGGAFQPASGTMGAIALNPLKSTYLDIAYTPVVAGSQQGELRIDRRRFPLYGTTVEPPLPKPLVVVNLKGVPPASGQQPLAAIHFDPAPRTSGSGTLRLEFHPSVAAATDDPAILFLTTASRRIDFTVIEGEPDAQFGPAIAIPLQTGTTAGTIVLTAELGDWAEAAGLEIPPQPVTIDAVQLAHTASGVDVQVNGYDNTRSLTSASFTFLQKDGAVLAPGVIQQDLTTVFRDYFGNATLGGSFQLKLAFPVTGNVAVIDSVRVTMTNSAGQTSWPAGQ